MAPCALSGATARATQRRPRGAAVAFDRASPSRLAFCADRAPRSRSSAFRCAPRSAVAPHRGEQVLVVAPGSLSRSRRLDPPRLARSFCARLVPRLASFSLLSRAGRGASLAAVLLVALSAASSSSPSALAASSVVPPPLSPFLFFVALVVLFFQPFFLFLAGRFRDGAPRLSRDRARHGLAGRRRAGRSGPADPARRARARAGRRDPARCAGRARDPGALRSRGPPRGGRQAGRPEEPEAARDQPAPDRARAPGPAGRAPQGRRSLGVRARRRGGAGARGGRRAVPHRAGRHRRLRRARLCRHPGDPSRPCAVGRLRHRPPCRRRRRRATSTGRRSPRARRRSCSTWRLQRLPAIAAGAARRRPRPARPGRDPLRCDDAAPASAAHHPGRGRGGRGQRRSRERHADRDRPGGGLERAALALARRGAGEPADRRADQQHWQSEVRGARCLAWACRSCPRPRPSRPSTSRC